jgi:hypothetical protein
MTELYHCIFSNQFMYFLLMEHLDHQKFVFLFKCIQINIS